MTIFSCQLSEMILQIKSNLYVATEFTCKCLKGTALVSGLGILYDLGLHNDRICLERTGLKVWQTPRDGHMTVVGGG